MSRFYYAKVARLVTWLTATLALLLLVVPSAFIAWNTYATTREQLDAGLQLQARIIEEYLQRYPDYWEDRLDRLRARFEPFVPAQQFVRLSNSAGSTLFVIGPQPDFLSQSRARTVHLFGQPVAQLTATVSQSALLHTGALVLLFSAVVAWAIWGPGRRLPLQALLRTELELRRHHEELETMVQTRTAELAANRDAAEEARRVAEAANKAKSRFLSHMSHELRTPLNAILGFGQLLEMDAATLEPSQADSVQEIVRAGGHLLAMVNEILDLARIESGRIEVHLDAVALAPILADCLTQVRPLAARHDIAVTPSVPAQATVWGDRLRVKQVLLNLLSNAIKYNRAGGQVRVTALAADTRLRIEVRDSGPGIAAEDLPRLFRPFERLEKSAAGEGTGIGLVLVKELVVAMHGEAGVDSTPGVGSTFWFELPLAPEQTGALAKQANFSRTPTTDNPR